MNKNQQLVRLVITIAIIIVVAWLIGLAFKAIAWLLNSLVGIAAIILIIALIYSRRKSPTTHSPSKKPPLKLEREPSKEKRS